jgi:4-amino-4-deoxy-L-arabinose transferase-like glycosyltransferase
MRSEVRLSAAATNALPRWLLLAICVVYAASGLFGRDPWKNEDAAGFGMMWTMANGGWHDWLLPNLVGKTITTDGPLAYWLGAAAIHLLNPLLDASDASRVVTGLLFSVTCAFVWYGAYLLGRGPVVQPFKYAFGGEPLPRDYGRTLADGALLILLGCFGLAERGHETTPLMAQLACVTMLMYGLIRGVDKPIQGALWWGVALGLVVLAANPVLVLALCASTVIAALVARALRPGILACVGLPCALVIAASWPTAALLTYPDDAVRFLHDWATNNFNGFGGPPGSVLLYGLKNLPLFTWPAWPLAIWSWYSWAGLRRAPHVAIPASVIGTLLILVVLQSHQSNLLFMLLLPPLAVLAAFGLPTLKRGAINAIDWFALLSFTILGSFVWLVWIAALTGFPHAIARNLARLVPGFTLEFNPYALAMALLITACWGALVRWRLSRQPKVLWRSVVLSSAGTTLMWVLLMTLWLPIVNYGRTYRDVATQIATHLPSDYACIRPARLGDAQIASFAYFGNMRFGFGNEDCDVILRQDRQDYGEPSSISRYTWNLVWQGRRPADRDERFRLYVRIEHPAGHSERTTRLAPTHARATRAAPATPAVPAISGTPDGTSPRPAD